MKSTQQQYRIAILGSPPDLAHNIAAILECDLYTLLCLDNAEELYAMASCRSLSLVIIATANYSRYDNSLYRTVERLRATGAEIFVITDHHSVRHTVHLLGAGVRQCMTMPLSADRLRRKVFEHLVSKPIYLEPVS